MEKILSWFALSILPAAVMATEVVENDAVNALAPAAPVAPLVPVYGFTPPTQALILEQQRLAAEHQARFAEAQNEAMRQAVEGQRRLAEQQARFAKAQSDAMQRTFEAQRRFAEQLAQNPLVAPAPFGSPAEQIPGPLAFPQPPTLDTPFRLTDLPQAPTSEELSSLSAAERRAKIQAYAAEVRKAMLEQRDTFREQIQAERTAALDDRG